MKHNKSNVIILFIIIFIDFMGFSLIFPLVPELLNYYIKNPVNMLDLQIISFFSSIDNIINSFFLNRNIENSYILIIGGILSSIYSFIQFLFSTLWGIASDKYGRKKILIFTSLGLSISYLLWFFSKSFSLFIVSRIIAGMMAGNVSVATASMADMSSIEKRSTYMGILGMGIGSGFIFGPLIGGILFFLGNKNIINIFIHPFSICALGSFVLSILSVLLNIFFLKETLTIETSYFQSKSKIRINRIDKKIIKIFLLHFIYMLVFTSYEFTFSFFYKFSFNLRPEQIGYILFYFGILLAIGQGFLIRVVTKKFNHYQLIRFSIIIISITFILQPEMKNLLFSLLSIIPIALGSSIFQPIVLSYASISSKQNEQGLILGIMRSLGSLARACGPLLGGGLYWLFGIQITYLIFFVIFFLIFFITFRL